MNRSTAHRRRTPGPPPPEGGKERLRRLEEQLEELIASVRDYAIFLLDSEGRVLTWNAGAEAIKGYRAEEIVGQHFSRFYPGEALATNWPTQELAEARKAGRFEDEGWRLRKDGSRFWANVVITALRDEDGGVRGYLKITRDLTERREAEEALRRAHDELERRVRERTDELERLDLHKNQFLAMLGHELRNPLAPIRNALEILAHNRDADAQERARGMIGRQVEHLVRLVDDLLDVSRIMHGKVDLRRAPTDLAAAVTRGIEAAQPTLDAHGHRLDVRLPGERLVVHGDVVRLAQVATNLLTNAAKYTPTPGRIEIALERDGDTARLTVRDPGIGIPRELLPRIFDFFVQGDLPLARSGGGLGIGLTLVRHLVELHGGTVEAESAGEWQGTRMTVRLPRVADALHATATPRARSATESRRVLVVDDNVDAADSLVALLEMWGHEAHARHDGRSVVPAVVELRPDVVLLDIGLPGMDGYEVARELRALPGEPVRLLVAVTGYGQAEDRARSAAAGFHVHLTKPVDPDRLQDLLAEMD